NEHAERIPRYSAISRNATRIRDTGEHCELIIVVLQPLPGNWRSREFHDPARSTARRRHRLCRTADPRKDRIQRARADGGGGGVSPQPPLTSDAGAEPLPDDR